MSRRLMPSLTRREALASGAALALGRMLGSPMPAAAGLSDAEGVIEVTIPIPARAFSRRVRASRLMATPPLRSPHRLAALGLTWNGSATTRLELRTRRRGRWSEWVTLPSATDHGPPSAGRVHATEAAAIGRARVFQLRAVTPPDGLRAHGIAVEPTAVSAAGRIGSPAAATPAIIPRSEWAAQAPRTAPEYGEVQLAFVHHTVSTNDYDADESAAVVRAIQHYHRNVLGWNDIGYQLLVDRHGQLFEGRAGGTDQAVVGAQAQGYNGVSTGVAVIGTHSSEGIGPAAFEALAAVLAWKLSVHGVPAEGEVTVTSAGGEQNRYPAGRPVVLPRISGHRDADSTACPGESLYAQLPALRARVAELAAPTGVSLAVSPRRVGHLMPATASGRVVRPDGTAGVSVPVEVQARTARGWQAVASSLTDATGGWSATVALPHTRTLRALAAVDPSAPPLVSPRVRLEVRSAIEARVAPRRLHFGRRTVVRGAVEPRRTRHMIVTVERRIRGGRYARVARFSVAARSGRFRVPLFPSRPGLYRVRLSARGDRLNAPSRSRYLFVRALR